MTKMIRLIALFCLLTQNAASEVLIRHPLASPVFYKMTLHSRPNAESLSQYLSESTPTSQQKKTLMINFEKAQRAFLGESKELAEQLFSQMINQLHATDWDTNSRHVFFYSLVRLAQLSNQKSDQEKWLKLAISFAPDFALDKTLFPPPLVEQAQNIKNQLMTESVHWFPFRDFHDYDLVSIDGRRYENREDLEIVLLPGLHRLSLFSNVYPSFSQTMNAEDIRDFRLERPPIVGGTCDAPQISIQLNLKQDLVATFDDNCLAMKQGKSWVRLTAAVQPAFSQNSIPFPDWNPARPTHAWLKNKWLWIGLGAVALGAAVAIGGSQNSVRTVTQPTHD